MQNTYSLKNENLLLNNCFEARAWFGSFQTALVQYTSLYTGLRCMQGAKARFHSFVTRGVPACRGSNRSLACNRATVVEKASLNKLRDSLGGGGGVR